MVRFGGGKSSTRKGAVEVAIQVGRQKIDVGLGVARPSRMEAHSSKKKWLLTGNTLSIFFLSEEG